MMKFNNGFWLKKEGFYTYSPAEVNNIKTDHDCITVYASCKPIKDRGETVNEPLLIVRFSSPIPDVIRVQLIHFKGKKETGPHFNLNSQENLKLAITDEEGYASLTSGKLSVRINKKNGWGIDFFNNNERITGSEYKSMGYITTQFKDSYTNTGNAETYIREQLSLGVGECVYGLGERFTSFVKNGQTVEIWNEDGGTASEQTYKNIPFYMTNKGYGVFVNHTENVSFEVASEVVTKVQFSIPGESLEYFVIGGSSKKDVLRNYTALTGRPSLPPAWSFGLWLTTSFTPSYDEDTVSTFINGMTTRDIPLQVFHFDCFWMKPYQLCDFEWDSDVFPDPGNMLGHLKRNGLKICVWINPFISQNSKMFDEGMQNGYLLKRPNGNIWQIDMWQPGMGIVDFTNPAACEWFADKLEKLVEIGVDCFKTDFGERIPIDVDYFDGSDPVKMHNFYSYLYNKTVYDILVKKLGKENAIVFSRSATVGSQMFPVHWGGDCSATYESMAESLRGGLSLCLSGFGFWSHDISGFENTATPDLYKRWVAFGLLSSHSRLHGSHSYRVPWVFDEEAVDVLRYFTRLKCSLMPYIYSVAFQASQEGIPVMRAMMLEFDDPTCDYLDRQYMLGDSLLVAPIFNEKGNAQYYLPEGIWTNFITGEKVKGSCWRNEKHNYMSIPLMVRSNSLIAVGYEDNKPDYDYDDNLTIHIFDIQDRCKISSPVYNMDGQLSVVSHLNRCGNTITFSMEGAKKKWSILLRDKLDIVSIEGGKIKHNLLGIEIRPNNISSILKIQFRDSQ